MQEELTDLGLNEGFRSGVLTLSPTGTRLALATGSIDSYANGLVRIYDVTPDEYIDPANPNVMIPIPVFAALDWAPDERAFAMLILSEGPEEYQTEVSLQVLELESETVRILDSYLLEGLETETLVWERVLSWAQ